MDQRRLKLQEELSKLGVPVYFQPPTGLKMEYPCLRYTLTKDSSQRAANGRYIKHYAWQLIYISDRPIDPILEVIADLPMCTFDRKYNQDGLSHTAYTLYY